MPNETYQPPFTMTEKVTNLIVEIGEYVDSRLRCPASESGFAA